MTVKDKKRGRPGAKQGQLTAQLIVETARDLMKSKGKVPSIRQVSGELGVDAMAIYHYFANKAALLEALTVSLIDQIHEPQQNADWQVSLRSLCQSYLELLQAYPGLLQTLLSMKSFGPAQLFSQRLQQALQPLQLSQDDFIAVRDLLADYMHGVALSVECNPQLQINQCIDGPLHMISEMLKTKKAH